MSSPSVQRAFGWAWTRGKASQTTAPIHSKTPGVMTMRAGKSFIAKLFVQKKSYVTWRSHLARSLFYALESWAAWSRRENLIKQGIVHVHVFGLVGDRVVWHLVDGVWNVWHRSVQLLGNIWHDSVRLLGNIWQGSVWLLGKVRGRIVWKLVVLL